MFSNMPLAEFFIHLSKKKFFEMKNRHKPKIASVQTKKKKIVLKLFTVIFIPSNT